ncbi:hypothetical protein PC129_g24193 [Phytophthora cactorum]|uniref:Secreted protein n=1 Tax=Phytophthora cactorum TaxID=29920 RepID=A0A8T1H0V8_9STRA|nr:hypothetical protein Pcac1_g6423 [Phytophthora cactorum]KAG2791231.1 hypothetical protein PC111_g24027 [Phytophthora cactorum]KAG2807472.1 hypothetical protein PC113_g24048 [Phytophthora cactorum]KAG2879579.1 hypothetical protein PC117_g26729 [Phytophthora cactorum]KAG2880320.1 hypothetical protein PC115_g22530 [Phytophthora cactorum]
MACRRWTKSIACVLNGLFSTAFFPAAGPACALSVPCTDVFFFAAGPACAPSVSCTDVLFVVAVSVPYTDP